MKGKIRRGGGGQEEDANVNGFSLKRAALLQRGRRFPARSAFVKRCDSKTVSRTHREEDAKLGSTTSGSMNRGMFNKICSFGTYSAGAKFC